MKEQASSAGLPVLCRCSGVGWGGHKALRLAVPNGGYPWEERRQKAPDEGSARDMPDVGGSRGAEYGRKGQRRVRRNEEGNSGRVNFLSLTDGDHRKCDTGCFKVDR